MAQLRNHSTGEVLAARVRLARGLLDRYVGFLTRSQIAPDEGLWFDGCSAVHTLGMRATVDLVFLDDAGRVLRCDAAVRPGRLVVSCAGSSAVLELGAGFLAGARLALGDALSLESGAA